MTTMSHIFLVHLTFGQGCCDSYDRTLRGFADKGEAEAYISDMRHRISRNLGLRHAVDTLMSDTWDKTHIAPEWPEGMTEGYEALRDAYYAHGDLRGKEVDRLLTLVGWDKTIDLHWEESYDLYIQEVPFGFEVVAAPTEEPVLAAAAE